MMGIKERRFDPLPQDISLEDLVTKDNFYRRLEATLDLSFVRELVQPLYAKEGRPSVDPVVFFRLQLVMFFENIRSERELMRIAADRLSVRWYLGYGLHEPLPFHSSLTRARERFGVEVFRRFFEEIVETCVEAGLVWGEEFFFDATKVRADADIDSLHSRAIICKKSSMRPTKARTMSPAKPQRLPRLLPPKAPLLCPPATNRSSERRTPLRGGTGSPPTAARIAPT